MALKPGESLSLITDEERDFLRLILDEHYKGGDIVEIGTYSGDGSTPLLLEASRARGGTLHALDLYLDAGFEAKVRAMFQGEKAHVVKGWSVDTGRSWKSPVSFAFIDGDHGYPRLLPNGRQSGVALDLLAWDPWLETGAIVAFHDYSGDAKTFGQSKFLPIEYAVDGYLSEPGYRFLGSAGAVVAYQKMQDRTLVYEHQPKKAPQAYRASWQRLDELSASCKDITLIGHGFATGRMARAVGISFASSPEVHVSDLDGRVPGPEDPDLPARDFEALDKDTHVIVTGSPGYEARALEALTAKGFERHRNVTAFMDFRGWYHLGRLGYW